MRNDQTMAAVLQINASYEPMAFCTTRRALKLIVKGKAFVEQEHERECRPGMRFPSVIRLSHQTRVPHRQQTLTRKNILLRDRHHCQYCDVKFHPSALTLDHVHPRSRGGKSTWANLVACCSPCNRRKADRTCEEAGMMLLHKPRSASIHTSRFLMRLIGVEDPLWSRYLYTESDSRFMYSN